MAAVPKRITKEIERIANDPPPGITCIPHEDNLRYFDVTLNGPVDSVYEGGEFKLELYLPDDYPMVAPKVRFLTKIYHPNIDRLGRICLDVLKSNWSPALQMRTILISIQALVGEPNPDDPLNNECAQKWKESEQEAWQIARDWTAQYAKPAKAKKALEEQKHKEPESSAQQKLDDLAKGPSVAQTAKKWFTGMVN